MKNKAFIQSFLKNWTSLTMGEDMAVSYRRYLLNKKFVFTEEVILKLKRINDILHEQAVRIRKQCDIIRAIQEKHLAEKGIDDYEFQVEMHCWNKNYYVKWDKRFYGNPFYTNHILYLFGYEKEDMFFTDNWNEFEHSDHPLSREFHCYFFHHLYDHTNLAWEDILRIDKILIEVKAWNQFFIKFPKKVKPTKEKA